MAEEENRRKALKSLREDQQAIRQDNQFRLKTLLDEYTAGLISQDEYRDERQALKEELKERMAELDEEIKAIQKPVVRAPPATPATHTARRAGSIDWDHDRLEQDMNRGSSVHPEEADEGLNGDGA